MAIVAPQVEAYFFLETLGIREIEISEDGGFTVYTFTLTGAAQTVGECLASWAAAANAEPGLALTYTFEITAGGLVSFAATGVFDLTLMDSLPAALGFSVAAHAGASAYTNDLTPLSWFRPLGADYDVWTSDEETEHKHWRWGRHAAYAHVRGKTRRIAFMLPSATYDALMGGQIFGQRIRVYTSANVARYSAANLTGYLDLYPFEVSPPQRLGVGDGHTRVELLCGVA